ncbi:MotA-like activator of middle period transcription [Acinetobacter phage 133]|uniref:MotA activator of middle period transcription n=1 Tax=Acinetobacter phage 133 TaxID=2919552 RepID=D9I6I5_9CAUD|nr:MotA-like activator of middle period transcription [Acinetobacter phage 133]ADJ19566.1 MotA activator of middle period transcription [Acinetobacter phage 133]
MNNVSCVARVTGLNEVLSKEILRLVNLNKTFFARDEVNCPDDLIIEEIMEFSSDKLIFTDKADDLMEEALTLFIAENNLVSNTGGTRKAVGVNSAQEEFKDYTLERVSKFFEVKDVIIDRSNYLVRLKKRTKGVRQFECMHKGDFRIFAYQVPENMHRALIKAGMTFKRGASNNAYYDIKCTNENYF